MISFKKQNGKIKNQLHFGLCLGGFVYLCHFVLGDGADFVSEVGLEPLFRNRTAQGNSLASLVHVCRVGDLDALPEVRLGRLVRSADGRLAEGFGPTPIRLTSEHRVNCEAVLDRLPSDLEPGNYTALAIMKHEADEGGKRASFTILPDPTGAH